VTRNISILVVEDNADMADLYRAYLEPDHQVSVAASAGEARRMLAERRPQLVLLDLMLADSSGDRFLRELREDPQFADMKMVLVSGRNDVPDIAQSHGIFGWLRKPFDMEDLLALVQQASGA
jgi:CheY-like chemotaxis protein